MVAVYYGCSKRRFNHLLQERELLAHMPNNGVHLHLDMKKDDNTVLVPVAQESAVHDNNRAAMTEAYLDALIATIAMKDYGEPCYILEMLVQEHHLVEREDGRTWLELTDIVCDDYSIPLTNVRRVYMVKPTPADMETAAAYVFANTDAPEIDLNSIPERIDTRDFGSIGCPEVELGARMEQLQMTQYIDILASDLHSMLPDAETHHLGMTWQGLPTYIRSKVSAILDSIAIVECDVEEYEYPVRAKLFLSGTQCSSDLELNRFLKEEHPRTIAMLITSGPHSDFAANVGRYAARQATAAAALIVMESVLNGIGDSDEGLFTYSIRPRLEMSFNVREVCEYMQQNLPKKWEDVKAAVEKLELFTKGVATNNA